MLPMSPVTQQVFGVEYQNDVGLYGQLGKDGLTLLSKHRLFKFKTFLI